MSTLTDEAPGGTRRDRPAPRLISGPLVLVFLCTFGTLSSFYLMLSVTPVYAAAAGSGSAGAGLVTGVLLLGTVAAELAAPILMKRFEYSTLLVFGAVLLGVPALALLSQASLGVIVAVSVIRGFGFGLSTVVPGALVNNTDFAIGLFVGALAGAVIYNAIFVMVSAATTRAIAVGLLYVLIWEALLSNFVSGARLLSVSHYSLGIANGIAHDSSLDAGLTAGVSIVMGVIVTVIALILAVRLLSSFTLKGEPA